MDVHLNWLNWFHFLILNGGLLVILVDCMIFLSLFVDVTRMSMSIVSFFAYMFCGILIGIHRISLYIEYFFLTYDLNGFKS